MLNPIDLDMTQMSQLDDTFEHAQRPMEPLIDDETDDENNPSPRPPKVALTIVPTIAPTRKRTLPFSTMTSRSATTTTTTSNKRKKTEVAPKTPPMVMVSLPPTPTPTFPSGSGFSFKDVTQGEVSSRVKVDTAHIEKIFLDYHTANCVIEMTNNWKKSLYAEMVRLGSFARFVSELGAFQPQDGTEEKRILKAALKKAIEAYIDNM